MYLNRNSVSSISNNELHNQKNTKKYHNNYDTSCNNTKNDNSLDYLIKDLCLHQLNLPLEEQNMSFQDELDTQLFHINYNEIPQYSVDFVDNDEIISNEIGKPPTLQRSNKSYGSLTNLINYQMYSTIPNNGEQLSINKSNKSDDSSISHRIKIKIRDYRDVSESSQNTIEKQTFISKYTPIIDNELKQRIVGDFNE